MIDAAVPTPTPPAPVRIAIRDLLQSCEAFQRVDPAVRRELAQGLVTIGAAAVALSESPAETPAETPPPGRATPLVRAQSAGSEFSGVAAQRVAGTTQQILNAVSFPRFVTELITGVFKAMIDSNQQQMNAYVELIKNVAASTEGFADANVGAQGARQWLVERFPSQFTIEGEVDDFGMEPGQKLTAEEQAERDAETRLRLKPNATMPSEAALRTTLGLGEQESISSGDPESLVPLVRNALAKSRQQMLATMVMLGMQRIVIESGRLSANMRFHIDTRSAASDDRGSTFDMRNDIETSGKFGYGPWGAEAKMKNTIGYVSTQKTQTTEEMNTDLDLSSSVELVFKTDYVPLDRLAGATQTDRIRVNTLNPDAELKVATDERKARRDAAGQTEKQRGSDLSSRLAPPAMAAPLPASGAPEPERKPAAKPKAPPPKQPPPAKVPPAAAPPAAHAAPGSPAAAVHAPVTP
jgi:hypothetical protein